MMCDKRQINDHKWRINSIKTYQSNMVNNYAFEKEKKNQQSMSGQINIYINKSNGNQYSNNAIMMVPSIKINNGFMVIN